MMRNLLLTLSVLAALCSTPVQASMLTYQVPLDGVQAGTGSSATGSASLVLDNVALTLSIDLTFSGLTTPTIAAHIHCCASPGKSAGIIIPFTAFPLGVTSGTFTDLFDLTTTQVSQLGSGLSYINIHTTQFPGGEIRGQIVPEPATFTLALAALVGFAVLRRRVIARRN